MIVCLEARGLCGVGFDVSRFFSACVGTVAGTLISDDFSLWEGSRFSLCVASVVRTLIFTIFFSVYAGSCGGDFDFSTSFP